MTMLMPEQRAALTSAYLLLVLQQLLLKLLQVLLLKLFGQLMEEGAVNGLRHQGPGRSSSLIRLKLVNSPITSYNTLDSQLRRRAVLLRVFITF